MDYFINSSQRGMLYEFLFCKPSSIQKILYMAVRLTDINSAHKSLHHRNKETEVKITLWKSRKISVRSFIKKYQT